ncbi:hypothetical protein JTB14_024288 [Gonioctena quinquepunctata]|nr:hypothetical protein JTB14_024288 [Gonioctena quinquepunctata]
MPRESEEDPIESKFSPTFSDVGKYINSNVDGSAYGLVDEQENSVDNQGVEIKNDDDIDIVYEDVKPEIFGETSGGKSIHKSYSNSNDDILMGPSSPHELAIVSDWVFFNRYL